ncbi:bifunctional 2-C-methyl-D-erythritol 4-phosphate cytidylyltransferase/2-C-methyl-D-erythritol 2,4-cyclodiphosphate synthase [Ponticoccus sp. SC2-23]|uniref:bifunctional 2-C-methyl-D-erythritol 4-phosphate cytidylyltransferase/2-C-methyl-D-erythritol 2,4-cyclodiphosphate synthase n=1 Tax=Alexandriicola marinus TaxID=2081710 RepID=UPI000FD99A25|nr:bifunctional 2-C-methyl-D-erythritol 4-phosphate cytidylyltransferase/2-C-methyl-D-erythritol 2,4-cyclodiphosphate synthase [Alexandriicola marinus]MBM1218825.1 bifunctional 2-C-methyl-D-erythritol 4-phosphate cytidylyltransferase/2-C-methyl-D-erythritol 2,4-cyclodiphosphate synthase [Ponticoccus sp. SC6-9]MBM1224103.1 bifunctional 2-C-methyl-D-erythritol 4-phosphate cytidylyltransferase/2-C-methyl-D-erythritol 2,4-cyclodiphosphate synthase [Ponticoccus sp. SC6-15]MBM1230118.1 bifunctional 2-
MTTAAVIVAAGRGHRAGGDLPKQWQSLAGRPVLSHTLDAMRAVPGIGAIALVIHPDDRVLAQALDLSGVTIVDGGATRDASVRAGLEALATTPPDKVLIHDAARPVLRPELAQRVIDELDLSDGAAPALAVTDALWRGADGRVAGTQDRTELYRAQTPQGFRFAAILAAHRAHQGSAADDVEVARRAGLAVSIVEGDEDLLKITMPGDFARAERVLEGAMDIRTGNGYDVHRFGDGDHVVLCGVKVPFDRGLEGHSDADVGMHAVTDAIYGALAEGDIGQHFPPSDPQWKGAASHIFLEHACALARERGYRITHADCTLVCEYPKIGPHAVEMKHEMARIMGLETDQISVKATTSERLGFTGRGEGIAALATATLVRP